MQFWEVMEALGHRVLVDGNGSLSTGLEDSKRFQFLSVIPVCR